MQSYYNARNRIWCQTFNAMKLRLEVIKHTVKVLLLLLHSKAGTLLELEF